MLVGMSHDPPCGPASFPRLYPRVDPVQRVARDLQRSVHVLESLRDMFEYTDEKGRDQGVNVRERAKGLVTLVNNPDQLKDEREKVWSVWRVCLRHARCKEVRGLVPG